MPSSSVQQQPGKSDQSIHDDDVIHTGHGTKHPPTSQRKLPYQQLSILAICRFAEPLASTSVFPYLPEMVESFSVPQDEIAKWAGLCASVFSLFQAIMGIPWGRASDRYGRKPVILLGLMTTMFTSLLWGFSTNITMAIVARGIAGAGNGNVGIIRTTVAEMVPFKELQPRAFSLMPLVWNVGSIFGPTIGGALSNPLKIEPPQKRGTEGYQSLLAMYPYALPNIVSALFFLIGITTGFLFLRETMEVKKDQRDNGIEIGKFIIARVKYGYRKVVGTVRPSKHLKGSDRLAHDETSPLLHHHEAGDSESGLGAEYKKSSSSPPSYREVINKQAALNLLAYGFLAMHTMTYDQILPVFMHHPPLCTTVPRPHNCIPAPKSFSFFKFAGGFGLNNQMIGFLQTTYGIICMLAQFFLFPPIARRFGILSCLKVCAVVFPITYFLTPFTALLPTKDAQMSVCFAIMVVKGWCAIFAFPCSTILLTNSASSLRTLGTLNGISTTVSAIGRGIGPAIGGATFTIGISRGFVIAPWWLLAAIGVLAAIPVFFIVEGEGFGGDDGEVTDDDDDEYDEIPDAVQDHPLEVPAEGAGPAAAMSSSAVEPTHAEDNYGSLGPLSALSRTSTVSENVFDDDDETEDTTAQLPRGEGSRRRRSSTAKRRPTSQPIGMGTQGVSRRYSATLGASFGSAGSFHGH